MPETITFKKGSQPYTLHMWFMSGKSLTHNEAAVPVKDGGLGVGRLAQRIADLKSKFKEGTSPLMVIDEKDDNGHKYSRYFYKCTQCPYEHKDGARAY